MTAGMLGVHHTGAESETPPSKAKDAHSLICSVTPHTYWAPTKCQALPQVLLAPHGEQDREKKWRLVSRSSHPSCGDRLKTRQSR